MSDGDVFINLLLEEAYFLHDCSKYCNKNRSILLVEGNTDKAFVNIIAKDKENLDCISVTDIIESNKAFRPTIKVKINHKNAIIESLVNKKTYVNKYPKNFGEWEIYGMVDKDSDELNAYSMDSLFVTDTHDLETLLLYSDPEIIERIKDCSITGDEIKKSYYIAYQLAVLRESVLNEFKDILDLGKINCGSVEVDFAKFTSDLKINLWKILDYINSQSDFFLSEFDIFKVKEQIMSSEQGKKRFDSNGNWSKPLDKFNLSKIRRFWKDVNGHDILQILRFINPDAGRTFRKKGTGLNRSFEFKLIEVYDYSKFINTEMYSKMSRTGLV